MTGVGVAAAAALTALAVPAVLVMMAALLAVGVAAGKLNRRHLGDCIDLADAIDRRERDVDELKDELRRVRSRRFTVDRDLADVRAATQYRLDAMYQRRAR